jgi:hypothetical protein
VAAAFNDSKAAESILRPLIAAAPQSPGASDARDWLTYLYMRSGEYRKAASLPGEMQAILSHLPDQSVASRRTSAVPWRMEHRLLFIPVSIGGKPARFCVDTDSNFSVVSETEARLLGLKMQTSDSNVGVTGATGKSSGRFRTAVAGELTVGQFRLRNVAFLVLSDDTALFRDLPPEQQGVLGIPVSLAFQTLSFGRDGMLRIGFASRRPPARASNLCFDGSDPLTSFEFQGRPLTSFLDTGDEVTEIWPPFARRFAAFVTRAGVKGTRVESGYGGEVKIDEMVMPELSIRIGGLDVSLRPAHVLLTETVPSSKWYFARLGLDALSLGRRVTIDFRSLTLSIE